MHPEEPSAIFREERPVYASFGARLVAVLIDGLILGAVGFLLRVPLGIGWFETSVLHNLISIVIGWLYGALQESGPHQATIGKRAMNIQVVNAQGQRISFAQASGRHFAQWLSAIILFIGYFMMLWDDRRQTLHDRLAGTFVVGKTAKRF